MQVELYSFHLWKKTRTPDADRADAIVSPSNPVCCLPFQVNARGRLRSMTSPG